MIECVPGDTHSKLESQVVGGFGYQAHIRSDLPEQVVSAIYCGELELNE